jgi:hypothetical protein
LTYVEGLARIPNVNAPCLRRKSVAMATRGIIAPVSGKLHQQKVEELLKSLLLEVPFFIYI